MKNIVDGINTAKGKNSELEDNINRNYPILKKQTEHQLAVR